MRVKVVVSPEATAQLRQIDKWWRENRPASPHLFRQEFTKSIDALRATPEMGRFYKYAPLSGVRRILLRASRKHIYYVTNRSVVLILAVWNAVGVSGPNFRESLR